MKKHLLYFALFSGFFFCSLQVRSQCLVAENGQYPDTVLTPQCIGTAENLINDGYAGEFSLVQLSANIDYVFSSSVASDFVTLADEDGNAAIAFGASPLTFTPTESIIVRFYIHTNSECGSESIVRSRRVQCGIVPACDPVTVPYLQGFENGQGNCLTYIDVNGQTNLSGWEINTIFPTDFGDRSMVYTYDSIFPGDDWFFTDGLALNAGTSYTLQFKYRSGLGPNLTENLEVKYGDAATVAGMTMPLLTFQTLITNFGDEFATATATISPTTTGTYYVGFHSYSEADQGYIQLDDITVDSSLANSAFDKSAISFYPNPVNDLLYIKSAEKLSEIRVYNLLGQKVFFEKNPENSVNLSNLESGAYIVKTISGSKVNSIKIIKI